MQKPTYANLKAKPENLGVTPLGEGEATKTMRVRGSGAAVLWAAGLTAAERGVIFATAHLSVTSAAAESTALHGESFQLGANLPVEVSAWWLAKTAEERASLLRAVYGGIAPKHAARTVEDEVIRRAWASGKYRSHRAMAAAEGWSKSAVGRAVRGIPGSNMLVHAHSD